MRCRNCGHQNPEQNRFCGMCGTMLPPHLDSEHAGERIPVPVERKASEEMVEHPAPAEPVARRTAAEPPPPLAPMSQAPHSDKWWITDEDEVTVGGPSFLGLSSSDAGQGGHSYLFEDEPERSYKGMGVLLVLLVLLGGALYAKWEPVRDFVLTTALSHLKTHNRAQDANEPASAPSTTTTSGDSSPQPAITTDSNAPAPKEDLPQTEDKQAGTKGDENAKPGDAAAVSADTKALKRPSVTAEHEEPPQDNADSESVNAVEEEKASAARKGRPSPTDAGSELVTSGEKYLYGRGVARNCDQAVTYFNAAAQKQNPQAFSHLGALYATGNCVPLDRAQAYAWFRRAYAKEPGNHYFEQNLTMLWREMTPDERQRATETKVSSF